MKVLHCPTDTGGNAWGLSRAEREFGIQSDVMVRRSSPLGYPCDVDLRLREGLLVSRLFRLTKFILKAARTYDVFHFNWGMSILDFWFWNLNYLELPLLKRLGKRIVVTFQGCDARMKGVSRRQFATSACAQCDVTWCNERMDRIRAQRIKKVFRYADQVFALNPDLLHVLPNAEFLPYASVNPDHWAVPSGGRGRQKNPDTVVLVHLPTNRSIKGTSYIEQAVTQLQSEGVPLHLELVEGQTHDQAQRMIAEADLVVDQLLIGWYGTVALEAMMSGKPVLCYLRDEDLKRFVPFREKIPIVRTTKETLVEDLRLLLKNRDNWKHISEAGMAFVREYHHPRKIAERTIRAYTGTCAE